MARITVEDCIKNINNRFELVLLASKRARQLIKEGTTPLVPTENDKVTVIALREIAANLVNKETFTEDKSAPRMMAEEIGEISKEIIEETQTIAEELWQPEQGSGGISTESE